MTDPAKRGAAPIAPRLTTLGRLAQLRTEWWLVLLASALMLAGLVRTGGAARLDYMVYDLLLRTGSTAPAAPADNIVIVAIDNHSLDAIGTWPWPRDQQARLVTQILAARPRAVGLDVLLVDARDPAVDGPLARAIAGPAPGPSRVYLPLAFNVPGPDGAPFSAEPPLPLFARAAAGIGHVNLSPDADGVIRRTYLRYGGAGQVWPALPAAMLGLPVDPEPQAQADLVGAGPVMIGYRGPRGSFPTVPASSVLRGEVPPALFAGRMVLIGMTASGLGDSHATPMGDGGVLMPGVEIQANILATLQSGKAIVPAPDPWPYLFALIPLALLFVAMRHLPPRATGFAALGLAVAISAASWALFRVAGVWLAPSCALIGLALSWPVWAWRKLVVASRYISRELERAAAEADDIAHPAPTGGSFLDRQLALLEDTTMRDRELRRQREDILRLLTHDMRAPQSSILALLDSGEGTRLDPEVAGRIRGYARRTLELADDFVNLSRAQMLEFTPEVLDLAELARDAADALWPQARSRRLRIDVIAPDDAEVLVAGEASLLARMLVNLTDNAIKYSQPDTAITITVSSGDDEARVVVTNLGDEIPATQIAVLFDSFVRAPGQAREIDGVGLGLAFVQTVAERHGGTAACRSSGGTTTFSVTLPLLPPQPGPE